jgi:hypothetical protein
MHTSMHQLTRLLSGMVIAPAIFLTQVQAAEPAPAETGWAQYNEAGQLIKPDDYREWVTIGTGLNMAYGPALEAASATPPFTNVFVSPAAYRAFLKTGGWPDRTLFILEIRAATPVNAVKNGSNGYFQGEILGIEAEVKDEKRFPGKWGFFGFGKGAAGQLIPETASCYSCHLRNAAVENTFVQFYPVLRDVAKEKGTFKTVPEKF